MGMVMAGLAGCATPIEKGPDIGHYLAAPSPYHLVEVMSGKENRERRDILEQALTASGISYRSDPFVHEGREGTNIFADLGTKSPTLIIAAHFDRTMGSPGANDNASCVAAAVSAYEMLAGGDPLQHIKLRFLFPDMEELGLIGSRNYIKNQGVDDVIGVISFEMCGIGDAFGIWDVRDGLAASLPVRALQAAGDANNVYNATHGPVPRYSSDHHVFFLEGIPAVGVTMLPKTDETVLRDYIENPNAFKWISTSNRPTIFQTYHTAEDTPATLNPETLEMTARIIVSTAQELDRLAGEE